MGETTDSAEYVAPVDVQMIREAAERIDGTALRTPLVASHSLAERFGCEVWLKLENLQRTGSFKVRGAYNRLLRLTPGEKERGVVAASAGNHAQGVAFAAAKLGIPATVVMPRQAPLTKRVATERLGARVELAGDSFDDAFAAAERIAGEQGKTLIHAFADPLVIAGQGTVGLEIGEELPDFDLALVPVGGGGLAVGVATALRAVNPGARIVGVQAANAPGAYQLFRGEEPVPGTSRATLADGLAVKRPTALTIEPLRRLLDDLVLVTEDELAAAILFYLEREHVVVEGAGAATLAAFAQERVRAGARRAVLVVSGGNIDVNRVARIIDRGLYQEGRYLRLGTNLSDNPGALRDFLGVIADGGGNILTVAHDRIDAAIPVGETRVAVTVEVRDRAHGAELMGRLQAAGFQADRA